MSSALSTRRGWVSTRARWNRSRGYLNDYIPCVASLVAGRPRTATFQAWQGLGTECVSARRCGGKRRFSIEWWRHRQATVHSRLLAPNSYVTDEQPERLVRARGPRVGARLPERALRGERRASWRILPRGHGRWPARKAERRPPRTPLNVSLHQVLTRGGASVGDMQAPAGGEQEGHQPDADPRCFHPVSVVAIPRVGPGIVATPPNY